MDQYIGKLLDNRYEILELVGVGGMARVYKARCHRLNRLVAIKILREDLAQDAELRRRFHDESQAVAMLSHPNIVAVYDVSRASDLEYIVMELIDGITLKQYMQKKGNKLNWREALHFITQIIKALGHAHSRGIIHRDIKPHNIMVLRDGSVKVADFGIARVMSGGHSTLTQEALGSVHYISPEQARGSRIDARSDLYSAGVVLYEMITGRLPFEGDTPVSVAIQHINSIPLSPREIDPAIPEALEAITMRAMAPNPDNRYVNADEMLADLEEFRKNPSINFDYCASEFIEEEEKNCSSDKTQVCSVGVHQTKVNTDKTRNIPVRRLREDEDWEEEVDGGRKNSVLPIIGAVALVFVFIGSVFFLLYKTVFSGFFEEKAPQYPVPDLRGQVYEEIRDNQELLGPFEVIVSEERTDSKVAAGVIMKQEPAPDTKVQGEALQISVIVSSGPEQMKMVDLYDMEYRLAFATLTEMGLSYSPDYAYHESVEKNHVISFTPFKDAPVKKGDEVHLVISMGPKVEAVLVPNLVEKPLEEAESELALYKLVRGEVLSVFSETIPAGVVVDQYPAAGAEVDEGMSVNLRVSKGPDPSLVPQIQVTKEIEIPLPLEGDLVNLVVMMDGKIVLEARYDAAMNPSAPVTLTGMAGESKTVTYFYDGVLQDSFSVVFEQ